MKKYYLFWITSNRGTDSKAVFELPSDYTEDDVNATLEKWCSGFGAWVVSETSVSYGYEEIKLPKREQILKKYNLICNKKRKIDDEWKTLAAMLNPRQI